MYRYLVDTKDKLDLLCNFLEDQQVFAYDTETNGQKDRFKVQMVGLSFGFDLFGCYLPFNHLWDPSIPQLDLVYAMDRLRPYFEDPEKEKICHNVKFDEMVLSRHGVEVQGKGHDTFIMAWMMQPYKFAKGDKALKKLVEKIFGYKMTTFEEVMAGTKASERDHNFAKVGVEEATAYAGDDGYWTYRLFYHLKEDLRREKLWAAYQNVERPFNRVTRHMEDKGVAINRPYVLEADEKFPVLAEKVEGEIYKAAGEVFKIGNPKKLGQVLFDNLKIQGDKHVPRTDTGNYSTDKKVLEKFQNAHPIVKNIQKRKKLTKTHSTFVRGLLDNIAEDGRVHPNFNGTGTRTGRLSCSGPNLQQIEGGVVEDIRIRNFFVPEPDYSYIVSDYSQIELRIMAHLAKDETMIKAFLSGMDFHEATAKEMLKVVEVLREHRVIAKTLNFGVGYGRGPQGIAEQIGCTEQEAQQFIDKWFDTFSGVRAYKKHIVAKSRSQGFVRTISGRKRRLLPDIRSNNYGLRMAAERRAFNTNIQGSAADIIKIAMIEMEPKLEKIGASIVLQIHDELVVECPNDRVEEGTFIVKDTMENPLNGKNPLRLPLVTEPLVVTQWGDAK